MAYIASHCNMDLALAWALRYQHWDSKNGHWPTTKKPDLVFFDPPYFDKKAADYSDKSISSLVRQEYLECFENFFSLMNNHIKKTTRLAFINADWPPARRAYAPEGEIFRRNRHLTKPLKVLS